MQFIVAQQPSLAVLTAATRAELARLIASLIKCDLLILDEFGYLTLDPHVGPVLYEIIAGRYEKGATVMTSNKSLATWGDLVGDTALMMAIIDRRLPSWGGVFLAGKFLPHARKRTSCLDSFQVWGSIVFRFGVSLKSFVSVAYPLRSCAVVFVQTKLQGCSLAGTEQVKRHLT